MPCEVRSRNHPDWPIVKTIPRPSRYPSTGEYSALHHNPEGPTLPRILVQIQLTAWVIITHFYARERRSSCERGILSIIIHARPPHTHIRARAHARHSARTPRHTRQRAAIRVEPLHPAPVAVVDGAQEIDTCAPDRRCWRPCVLV